MHSPHIVYSEQTPNPLALKIILGVPPVTDGYHLFSSVDQVAGCSVLEDVLSLPGVQEILLAPDFITVTKAESVPWTLLESVLMSIFQHRIDAFPLDMGAFVVKKPAPLVDWDTWVPETPDMAKLFEDVKVLIDDQVRPAIEGDGGMIDVCAIKDGVLYVRLQGACSSCMHAEDTLKGGIQQAVCHYFPEITSVETVDNAPPRVDHSDAPAPSADPADSA